ncbi:hypothetical protein SBRCBS47491_010224 [Sporothrix bragantina]|uniref:Xylanolytic transcriptional activator regulatory domain-containing protein n=1 Tax=Sporothrix bragantina TaxID=671064 RepID=A0ABP0D4B5_9PEZI
MPDYTDPFQCAFNAIATDMTTPGIANINQSSPEIMYTYYPFLTITSLPRLLPQDVNYLEQQGCMRIPTRPILDEFVQQYFLHVHPMMPLFHEGDFWDQYSQQNMPCETGSAPSSTRMSVLAFQALLFASCNFVSEASVRALGFPTIRAARAALYRRAKLLYDFDTEPSAVVCAQAALLLTFWSPYGNKKINSVWLNIAVQQARLAEAHLYASLSRHNRHTNKLKRLWWCCIIRDRLLSLGVRRSIQIPRTQFDIDHHPPLNVGDLADEIAYSRVYNLETKKCLVAIVARVAELSVVLTDVLMLAYPPYAPTWDAEEDQGRLHRESEQSDKCKLSLNQWYASVSLQLPLFGGPASDALSMSAQRATTGAGYSHDSVILYTNLMYMYYHVPITAFPLFLQTVDVKLSTLSITASMQPDLIAPARKQRHLDILIEAMRTYQPQYEGVDWVRESICHAVNLAQLDGLPSLPQTQTVRRPRNVYDWTDIFENNPSSYLRLTFSMDIALRTNRLPEEHDFPKSLRGLFTGGFSPIRNLFCSAASAAMSGSPTTPAPRMQSPQLVSGILSENNTSCAKQAPRCNGQQTPPPQATTTVDGDVYLSTMTPSNLFLDDEGTIMDDFSLYYGMELGSTEVDRVTELDEPMPQSNIEDDD